MLPEKRDEVYLVQSGIFMLYEKFYTLKQINFTDP